MTRTIGVNNRERASRWAFGAWGALLLLLTASGLGVAFRKGTPAPTQEMAATPARGELHMPTVPPAEVTAQLARAKASSAPDFSQLLESKVNPADYLPRRDGPTFRATNAVQKMSLHFDSTGVVVQTVAHASSVLDVAHASSVPGEAGKDACATSLRTAFWGRTGAMRPLTSVAPKQDGARVVYPRAGLTEWYENRAGGLEQGFTVAERPAGQGDLRLELAVSGARAELNGTGVRLQTNAGRTLSLDKLLVKDAAGGDVPAKFAVGDTGRVVLAVDDRSAQYPLFVDPTLADDCWRRGFYISGMSGTVSALAVNQATGEVYAGGSFLDAGDKAAYYIAKWDGANWTTLGSGMNSSVSVLVLDGSGNLYAGGGFTTAGGVTASHLAKWNGSTWSSLGNSFGGAIHSLNVYAIALDANGNLWVGGDFITCNGLTVNHVVKYDGSAWTALTSGTNDIVRAIALDGAGNVYVGGDFTTAGGSTANYIAKWDGTSWTTLGAGTGNTVSALVAHGSTGIYVGGAFTTAGPITANRIASWDGVNWSTVGTGMNGSVTELAVDGFGNLYAGGGFTSAGGVTGTAHIAKWNGSAWSAFGTGTGGGVSALALGPNTTLYAGGAFSTAGGGFANNIAMWNGSAWVQLGAAGAGMNDYVHAVAADGSGNVYAGGEFLTAGPTAATRIAEWNGSSWSAMGTGMNNTVSALATFGSSGSAVVYAGGAFTTAGGTTVNRVAMWNGSTWATMGGGMNGAVNALVVDANGNVYAGGSFTSAGSVTASHVAKWSGGAWSAVGNGMNGVVYSLAVTANGQLYAGGDFTTSDSVTTNRIAFWSGTAWAACGSGMSDTVRALLVDGSGIVYAGGDFVTAGGGTVNHTAKWDGTNWTALGSGTGTNTTIYTLALGSGGSIYAGGSFTTAGGGAATYVAKWNGSAWSALGTGVNNTVYALCMDSNANLCVGGTFSLAGTKPSLYFAQYHEPARVTVTSASPNQGVPAGGQRVTLAGTGFATSGAVSVTFGGLAATAVTLNTATQLACTTPVHVPAMVDVVVTNPDGWQGSGLGAFTYMPPPAITGIVPTHGPATLPWAITINGSNFVGTPAVTFGGTSATGISATSGRITCTAPTHAAGTVTVVVTNPDTQTGTVSYTFDPAPTITAISPEAGPAGTATPVTIAGSGFLGTPSVTFDGHPATGISATATQITCTAPTHATTGVTVAVVVTNPDTQAASAAFYYGDPPTVTGVAPGSGPSTGATPVTVTGTLFVTGASVDFGGSLATSVTVVSETEITCATASHAIGVVQVTVTNPDGGHGHLAGGYEYLNVQPVVESDPWATPAMVVLPATSTLRVVANDADNAPVAMTFTWSKVTGPGTVTFNPNGTNAASTTAATFSAAGTYTIQVSIYDGAATVVSNAVTVIAENSALAATVKGDMNGDGKSDIILQNYAAGTLTVWPMNGSGNYASAMDVTNGGSPVSMGTNSGGWTLVGCGDFNNDGKQDLVFQNIAGGQIQIWLMDRLAVTTILPLRDQNGLVMNLGANSGGWQVGAVEDFNGDGRPELLLQNYASGALTIWTVGGASYSGGVTITNSGGQAMSLGTNSGGWHLAGSGDFNKDGKADLLFQNTSSGTFTIWLLNRTVFSSSSWLTNNGSAMNLGANSGGWTVGGCADYTSDGKCDVVIQNVASGAVSIWALNGTAYSSSITIKGGVNAPLTLGANSGGWTVCGCGDVNADGKAEVFWQNYATGAVSGWKTSGYNYTGSLSIVDSGGHAMGLGTNSSGWTVVGFADFNGDGKPDLLMQNVAQGVVCIWLLNGNKFSSGTMITTSGGAALSLGANSGGWRVVGAADFTGDGKVDLFLQNDALGLLNIWALNGTVFTAGYYITDSSNNRMSLGTNSGGWRAAGLSDFNNNGKMDIVMQNDALGLLTVWFLNGSKFVSSGIIQDTSGHAMSMGNDSSGWRIRGCGDINGDGKKEVLWQHQATGYSSMWILNGLTYLGGGMILDPNGATVNLGANSGGWSLSAPR